MGFYSLSGCSDLVIFLDSLIYSGFFSFSSFAFALDSLRVLLSSATVYLCSLVLVLVLASLVLSGFFVLVADLVPLAFLVSLTCSGFFSSCSFAMVSLVALASLVVRVSSFLVSRVLAVVLVSLLLLFSPVCLGPCSFPCF